MKAASNSWDYLVLLFTILALVNAQCTKENTRIQVEFLEGDKILMDFPLKLNRTVGDSFAIGCRRCDEQRKIQNWFYPNRTRILSCNVLIGSICVEDDVNNNLTRYLHFTSVTTSMAGIYLCTRKQITININEMVTADATATITRSSTSMITVTAIVTAYIHTSNTSAFVTATLINSTIPLSDSTNSSIVGVIGAITAVLVVSIIIVVVVIAIILIWKKNKSKQHIEQENEYHNITDETLPRPLTNKLEPQPRMDIKHDSIRNEPEYLEMLDLTKQVEGSSEDQIKMQDNPSYFISSKHQVKIRGNLISCKHQFKIQDSLISSKHQVKMQDNPAYLISSKDKVKMEDNPSYRVASKVK